ncbi:hypothetical protein C4568_04455 [Candidatus Parcubacteria bacterium]|nr:MAG: hypothetical protein C4568_04455 [Candidatus Parcubacteria bacterium]
MTRPSLSVALIALSAALIAWVGVFFFVQSIHKSQAATEKAIRDSKQANTSKEGLAQLLAVITATESGRAEISKLLTIDLLTLANEVKKVGVDAGVELEVLNASPEPTPGQKGKDSKAFTISAVNFTIEAEGSFDKLHHALMLLETLPVPSRVEEVSFTEMKENPDAPWNMKLRLRIITALPVNS